MENMKAAVFEDAGKLTLKQVPIPAIKEDRQVLLRVDAASICGTDVHITSEPPGYAATPGTILGHELVGTVAELGSAVDGIAVGDRVVVNPNDYCGECVFCRGNLPNLCNNIKPLGIDYDGAFAEYCLVNSRVCHKIDSKLPVEIAACTEPLACAVNGLKKVNILPGECAVLIGAGPIGLIIAMLLKASGIGRLYILETAPFRCEFARKLRLGRIINPVEEDVSRIVLGETGLGADYVFDVTGSQMLSSIELVRKGGKVVLFGVNNKASGEIAQRMITTKEISVIGTWLANATFPEAVRILEGRLIDLSPIITHVISLDEVHEGIKMLAKGNALKVVVKP